VVVRAEVVEHHGSLRDRGERVRRERLLGRPMFGRDRRRLRRGAAAARREEDQARQDSGAHHAGDHTKYNDGVGLETGSTESLNAIDVDERIGLIDALRGFALFGVLIANLPVLSGADYLPEDLASRLPTAGADKIVERIIAFLIDGKFITLFSFLFGVGFSIQLERARRAGLGVSRYARRLGVMLALGVAHATLIWWGDILTVYALLGFVLLLFRRASDRTLVIWGFALIASRFFGGLLWWLVGRHFQPNHIWFRIFPTIIDGDVGEVVHMHTRAWIAMNFGTPLSPFWNLPLLGNMLLGYWFGRKALLADPAQHARFFRRLFGIALTLAALGAASMGVMYWHQGAHPMHGRQQLSLLTQLFSAGMHIETMALAATYLSAIALLWRRPRARRALERLVPIGRMCVTNYLSQSVICTLLFYHAYGVGLAGGAGFLGIFGFGVGLYTIQVIVSRTWLTYYRFGPVEWLWRSLTYGKRQRMRVAPALAPTGTAPAPPTPM
jgi:uncharacterized protein